MSTLATNKLGTLAGTADMKLPASRPTSTQSAYLDAAGNLTFEESTTRCEFFVDENQAKVCRVLVDVANLGQQATEQQAAFSGNDYWGVSLSLFSLPDSIKNNYLAPGNIRRFCLQFNIFNGDTGGNVSGLQLQPLDRTNNSVLGTQSINDCCRTNTGMYSSSASRTGSSNSASWGYTSGQYGGFNTYFDNVQYNGYQTRPGNTMGYMWYYPYYGAQGTFYGEITTSNTSSTYGPNWGNWDWCWKRDQSGSWADDVSNTIWADVGGFAFAASSNNVDQKPRLSYMNATLWADVKPTTVVAV
tara:strand:- start:829 stop:1731 length:903 start_codon:yes stop_codon:yes gene_type:complete